MFVNFSKVLTWFGSSQQTLCLLENLRLLHHSTGLGRCSLRFNDYNRTFSSPLTVFSDLLCPLRAPCTNPLIVLRI